MGSQGAGSPRRLRPALVPCWPPYLAFLPPGAEYTEPPPEGGLGVVWRLAPQTSVLVRELVERLGASVVEWQEKDLAQLDGPAWDHLLVCERTQDDDFK